MCRLTFCVDIGRHLITRLCEVLATISTFGKYLTENTNELLKLWVAVMITSTVSLTVALMTCGPSICGGKHAVKNSNEYIVSLSICKQAFLTTETSKIQFDIPCWWRSSSYKNPFSPSDWFFSGFEVVRVSIKTHQKGLHGSPRGKILRLVLFYSFVI